MRTHTPPVVTERPDGTTSTTITVQRCCNGCGHPLGDVTDDEIEAVLTGDRLQDVRYECPRCTPRSIIEVCEPTPDAAGSISARASRFGPEICYAVGREHGDWYVIVNDVLHEAAGIKTKRIHVAGSRDGAEQLVRLLAGLYDVARGGR